MRRTLLAVLVTIGACAHHDLARVVTNSSSAFIDPGPPIKNVFTRQTAYPGCRAIDDALATAALAQIVRDWPATERRPFAYRDYAGPAPETYLGGDWRRRRLPLRLFAMQGNERTVIVARAFGREDFYCLVSRSADDARIELVWSTWGN